MKSAQQRLDRSTELAISAVTAAIGFPSDNLVAVIRDADREGLLRDVARQLAVMTASALRLGCAMQGTDLEEQWRRAALDFQARRSE